MRATRYGSSPNVSSVRPHRGSRQTSSTGESPWWAPIARISTRTASARAVINSGCHVLATPIACGKIVASRAIRPEQISSWTIAGMPRRVSVDEVALHLVGQLRGCAGVEAARPGDPRDLAEAVAQQRRRPRRIEAVAVGELEHPGAAELGDLLLGRHAGEQVGDPLGDRERRVAVGGAGRGRLDRRHDRLPTALHDCRSTSLVGRVIC